VYFLSKHSNTLIYASFRMNIQCTAAVSDVKETNQEDIFYIIGSKYLHICYFYLTTLVNQYCNSS